MILAIKTQAIFMNNKIPVTVLTGFLGSGKTTLLNRILHENHGQRIAVIENEFGEIGIDQDLVINADEEIFEMNNGCICCTVRGDLIRILGNLVDRKDKFDRVLLETTGMADPGPVAQTFFLDEKICDHFYLDGIITLVDAKHIQQHWHESDEAAAQIAFADVILLNKIDLVTEGEQHEIAKQLQNTNKMALIIPVQMANAPLEKVLQIGGFDLDKALQANPLFLEPEYPFEWAGIYQLPAGEYQWKMQPGPDASMSILIHEVESASKEMIQRAAEKVFPHFAYRPEACEVNQPIPYMDEHCQLLLSDVKDQIFSLTIEHSGYYAFFTEHHPDEFAAVLLNQDGVSLSAIHQVEFNPGHEHDQTVSSVAFEFTGSLDLRKFESWLNFFLQANGNDIFRMKGIVAIKDEPNRFVFQGVHMLFDAKEGKPWGDEKPFNRMVFIGRNLDKLLIEGAFRACL